MTRARVLSTDTTPQDDLCADVVATLDAGGVVVLPTDTIYGLSCRMDRPEALERICAIKGRDRTRGLILLIARAEEARALSTDVSEAAEHLVETYWPGPLTLLFRASPSTPHEVLNSEGLVAVRCPKHPLLEEILHATGVPITSTSVNRAGEPPLVTPAAILREFGDVVDLVVDAGATPSTLPSTIVDASGHTPRMVRVGELVLDQLALDT